jgi:phosphate transport system permease protein
LALTTVGSSGEAAIQGNIAQALRGSRTEVRGRAFEAALIACLLISLIILGLLIANVLSNGLGVYSDRGYGFLDGGLSSQADRAGIAQGIIGSFWIAVAVVVLAIPVGIGAAIYLEEYAPRNWLTSLIELTVRNLAGVPSVVYGLLGLAIFVESLDGFSGGSGVQRRTLAAAGLTLAVLVLPIVIITSSEALRAVPDSIREAGYGVGATRWQVIRSHVVPSAAPGIFTGTVLTLARALGETAPLLLVGALTGFFATGASGFVDKLQGPYTSLPTVIFSWSTQPNPDFRHNTAAAILVLLAVLLTVNALAIVLRNRYERRW